MFSYVFHGIFGDIVAPRPSKRKEIWAFLKAGLFDKALTALRSPQHGFDPNEKEESSGMVALQYAAAAGKLDLVVELLVQGAEVSATDNSENTALHYAAQNEHRTVVEVLLRYGADPSLPNVNGNVAVEMTRNPAITELFMRDKANIFSPVVQAKKLFAEFLSQHQLQLSNSSGSQTASDSKSFQGGEPPHPLSTIESYSENKDTAISNQGLNLETEFNEAFSNLSLQNPDQTPTKGDYTLVGVVSTQKPSQINQSGYQPINQFSPASVDRSTINNQSFDASNANGFQGYSQPQQSSVNLSYHQNHVFTSTPLKTPGIHDSATHSSYFPGSVAYSQPSAYPAASIYHSGGHPTATPSFFSPDDHQRYQSQAELSQSLVFAAQETSRAKWHCTTEEYDARKALVLCCQKFNEARLRSYLTYDPSLPMARLFDLQNLAADGQTPLHAAAKFGSLDAIKLFLELGEDVSVWVRDLQGRTPLHIAAEEGHSEMCAFLREKMREEKPDCDPIGVNAPTDLGGTTPLGWAKKRAEGRPKLEIEKILFDRGDASILQHTPHEKRVGKSPWKSNLFSHSISEKENVIYAFSEAQGWAPKMEDRISVACPVYGRPAWSLFAVFDGHGGTFTASYLAKNLPIIVSELASEGEKDVNSSQLPGGVASDLDTTPELLESILTKACEQLDDKLSQIPRMKVMKSGGMFAVKDSSGSTGIIALITSAYIAVANVGDSRAVLARRSQTDGEKAELRADPFAAANTSPRASFDEQGDRLGSPRAGSPRADGGGVFLESPRAGSKKLLTRRSSIRCALEAQAMSRDHKAVIPEERNRALKAGATVRRVSGEEGSDNAVYEVYTDLYNGRLRMTRSFGDFYLKRNREVAPERQAVIALPEVKVHTRNSSDAFLVLACDGVFDVMSNQQVVEFMGEGLGFTPFGGPVGGINPTTAAVVCDELLAECLERGSHDNMSVILIIPAPPVSATAVSSTPIAVEDFSLPHPHMSGKSIRSKSPAPLMTLTPQAVEPVPFSITGAAFTNTVPSINTTQRKSISSITNEIDISQYQYATRLSGSRAINSMLPPPDNQLPTHTEHNESAALHQQTPPSIRTKSSSSRRKSMLQQVFNTLEDDQPIRTDVDDDELFGDEGIASPLNTAVGTSRVRKQLQYE